MRITGTFDAAGQSSLALFVLPGQQYHLTLDGQLTDGGSIVLEQAGEGIGSWTVLATYEPTTDAIAEAVTLQNATGTPLRLRLRAASLDDGESDEVVYTFASLVTGGLTMLTQGRAGTTAGWVVSAADEGTLAALPKNITAGTLVVPVPCKEGDVLTGFVVFGAIGADTDLASELTVSLRAVRAGTDAAIGSLAAAIDVIVDGDLNAITAGSGEFNPFTVQAGDAVYLLLTGTTADDDACDITVQSVGVQFA